MNYFERRSRKTRKICGSTGQKNIIKGDEMKNWQRFALCALIGWHIGEIISDIVNALMGK
jgi:hypothetical protein